MVRLGLFGFAFIALAKLDNTLLFFIHKTTLIMKEFTRDFAEELAT